MKEEFVVSKIKNGTAYISLTQKEKCGGCKACALGRGKKISLPAIMDVSCGEGDTVMVEMPQKDSRFSLLLFVIPLVFLVIGFIIGGFIGGDLARFVAALVLCALSFALALPLERLFRSRREYMPVITEVIKESSEKMIINEIK